MAGQLRSSNTAMKEHREGILAIFLLVGRLPRDLRVTRYRLQLGEVTGDPVGGWLPQAARSTVLWPTAAGALFDTIAVVSTVLRMRCES